MPSASVEEINLFNELFENGDTDEAYKLIDDLNKIDKNEDKKDQSLVTKEKAMRIEQAKNLLSGMTKGGSKRRGPKRPKRTKRRPSKLSRSKLSKKKRSKKSKKKRKKTRRRRR